MSSEKRRFGMHENLLKSIIKNQADSFEKSAIELVMNCIDAGASKIEMTLNRNSLTIFDDGKGFASREEVEHYFERFGTPHQKGDAVFGRFRIGRGQLFAYAKSTWRSNSFEMFVDIENTQELTYQLRTGLPRVAGCRITAELYEPLSPSDVFRTTNTIREQVKYCPIPIIFNGERINVDATKEKWTEITDEAYIKIIPVARTFTIYNQGIFVCHEDAASYGAGGIVVSRTALEVNFARNAVIKSACPVWKAIRPVVAKHVNALSHRSKEKKTDSWRQHKIKEMLSWGGDFTTSRGLAKAPCFTDISGKHWSLDKLLYRRTITIGKRSSLVADRLQASGQAVVLDEAILSEHCRPLGFVGLLRHIENLAKDLGSINCLYDASSHILEHLVEFDTLAATITSEHHVLAEKELTKLQAATLRSINRVQYQLALRLSMSVCPDDRIARRRVGAMKSETSQAITDGRSAIYLRIDFLSGADNGPANGISWAVKVVNLLVHEYLHDFNSGVGHTHDAEFYELYHDATQSTWVTSLAWELFRGYASALKKLSPAAARVLDAQAMVEDRLGAPQPLPAITHSEGEDPS